MSETTMPDAYAAYQAFLPAAKALPAADILRYRIDPDIAIINIETAMNVIRAHGAQIGQHLPKIDINALRTLPELALAVKFAAVAADQVATDKTTSEMLAEARQIRATLLRVVGGLAATGLVPETTYEAIVRGSGTRDLAEDCVALHKVFQDGGKALKGKHAADPAMIERAGTVGSWLLRNLRKAGAPTEKQTVSPEADIRNRLATLLVSRYERLRVVAHYFHGAAYEDHAPPLMSRKLTRRPAAEPAEPAPSDSDA